MQQTYNLKERLLAWVLTLAMVVGMFPSTVFATDTDPVISFTFSNPTQGTQSGKITAAVSDTTLNGSWEWTLTTNSDKVTLTDDTTNAPTITANTSDFAQGDSAFTVGFTATYEYSTDGGTTTETITKSDEITFTPPAVVLPTPQIQSSQSSPVEEGVNNLSLKNESSFPSGTVFTWSGTDISSPVEGTGVVLENLRQTTYTITCTADLSGAVSSSATYTFTPSAKPTANYKVSVSGDSETTGSYVVLTGSAMNTDENVADTAGTWYWQVTSSNGNMVSLTNHTSASPTITLTADITSSINVTVKVTYTGADGGTATNTHTVTFKIPPNYTLDVSFDGQILSDGDTIPLVINLSNQQLTATVDSGTVKWTYSNAAGAITVTGSTTNNFTFSTTGEGTATATATHPNDSSLSISIIITVSLGDPSITLSGSAASGTVDLTGNRSTTVTIYANRTINWTTSPSGIVQVDVKSEGKSSETISLTGLANGTAVVTGTLTGVARASSSSVSFTVNVTGIDDSSGDSGNSGGSDGGSGDSGGSDGDSSITKEYIPVLNWSGASGNVVLASKGNYADRKILVTAEQVDNGASTATSNELSTAATSFSNMLQWKMDNNNLVEMVNISGGQRFYYSVAGETKVTYWIDKNNNMEVDADEEAYSGTFTITNTGITVSDTNINMSTYANSSTIYVYAYGDVGTVTSASQNTTLVTVTQNTIASGVYTLVLASSSDVGETSVLVSYTGGSETIDVSIADAVAGSIDINEDYGITTATPLYFKDILDQMHEKAGIVYAGESLVRVQSLEVEPSQGILYVGYQDVDHTGGAVGTSLSYYVNGSPSLGDIVFVPNPNFTGNEVVIVYTGYTTSGRSFYGEITVTLGEVKDVQVVTTAQTPVDLVGSDFNTIAQATMAQSISTVVFTLPDENQAKFYYEYDDANNYHHQLVPGEVLTLKELDRITIVPSPGYGTPAQHGDYTDLNITYTVTGTNNMVKTQIMLLRVYPYLNGESVVYNTRQGEYLTLVTDDFHENSRYNSGNYNQAGDFEGVDMAYIVFSQLPNPKEGVLYEDYRTAYDYRKAVSEDIPYYASYREPGIAEVSFVPAEGFSGVVNIPFIGYDLTGASYEGNLQINVTTHVSQDINYICTSGSYVSFYAEDFNQLSRNLVGNNIESITFTGTPDAYQGSVRLGQTPDGYVGVDVFTGTNFYRTASPYIDTLSFNSASGFTGTVEIPFDGRSTTGQIFSATISITVTNQNVVQIPYSATRYYPVTFNQADFEKYAVLKTESELDYVRFDLPDESVGTLYYDYTDLNDYESLVTIDDNFYSGKSQYLSKVTFVPAADFVGTAYVDFKAWGENGQDFVGRISIMVAESGDPLHYSIHSGEYFYLNSSAMNAFCRDQTGDNLDYITISLPTMRQGTLYQVYSPYTGSGDWELASSSKRYYRSEDYNIGDLAFVSEDYFVGTVELSFTAVSDSGLTCSGSITIVVMPLEAQNIIEYYTSFSPIVFKSADIAAVWNDSMIDYIQLHNLPSASAGKLYYENNLSSFATLDEVYYGYDPSRGYSIDTMIFVPQAGYTGTVALAYTAMTVAGTEFTGEIHIIITPQQVSQFYVDLGQHTWAISSADYLNTTQVSFGIGNYQYGPSDNITRADYALMVQKAFRFGGTNSAPQFSDVNSNAYYASAISTLRELGIVTGEDNLYRPEEPISRQDAMIILCRAMEVAQKDLPTMDISVLYRFKDVTSVYIYASGDLSIMVQAGIVSGDTTNNLNPQALMTRAEMAVVIHKAMTY